MEFKIIEEKSKESWEIYMQYLYRVVVLGFMMAHWKFSSKMKEKKIIRTPGAILKTWKQMRLPVEF
jgi:hypothetical protein